MIKILEGMAPKRHSMIIELAIAFSIILWGIIGVIAVFKYGYVATDNHRLIYRIGAVLMFLYLLFTSKDNIIGSIMCGLLWPVVPTMLFFIGLFKKIGDVWDEYKRSREKGM